MAQDPIENLRHPFLKDLKLSAAMISGATIGSTVVETSFGVFYDRVFTPQTFSLTQDIHTGLMWGGGLGAYATVLCMGIIGAGFAGGYELDRRIYEEGKRLREGAQKSNSAERADVPPAIAPTIKAEKLALSFCGLLPSSSVRSVGVESKKPALSR